ncbi:MAG: hypothetical protein QHG99_02890 [Methanomicrobiales archaeon]|nr:hypothetical protein [Methanomicrobiales archaeon]
MMSVHDIFVNRRGINSIELPRQVEMNAGGELLLRFVNKGHPTHISISALNQQLYTDFIQENLYVADEMVYSIPIKDGPYSGVFDIEVVTGYGTKRAALKVFVTKKPEPAPESQKKPEEARTPLLSHMNLAMVQWLMLAFGILVFLIWILLRSDIFLSIVDALLIIAFVLVVAGVFVAWFSQRQ